jgi:hypothetical protein
MVTAGLEGSQSPKRYCTLLLFRSPWQLSSSSTNECACPLVIPSAARYVKPKKDEWSTPSVLLRLDIGLTLLNLGDNKIGILSLPDSVQYVLKFLERVQRSAGRRKKKEILID